MLDPQSVPTFPSTDSLFFSNVDHGRLKGKRYVSVPCLLVPRTNFSGELWLRGNLPFSPWSSLSKCAVLWFNLRCSFHCEKLTTSQVILKKQANKRTSQHTDMLCPQSQVSKWHCVSIVSDIMSRKPHRVEWVLQESFLLRQMVSYLGENENSSIPLGVKSVCVGYTALKRVKSSVGILGSEPGSANYQP